MEEDYKYTDDECRALLIHQGNVSGAHAWLHSQMAKHYSRINTGISLVVIVLSCISSILGFLSLIDTFNNVAIKIIVGVIGAIIFCITSAAKAFRLTDLVARHTDVSGDYINLFNTALRSVKIRGEHGEGLMFALSDFNDDFYKTFNSAPKPWSWVISIYMKKYAKNVGNIKREDLCGIHRISEHPKNISDVTLLGNLTRAFVARKMKRSYSSEDSV